MSSIESGSDPEVDLYPAMRDLWWRGEITLFEAWKRDQQFRLISEDPKYPGEKVLTDFLQRVLEPNLMKNKAIQALSKFYRDAMVDRSKIDLQEELRLFSQVPSDLRWRALEMEYSFRGLHSQGSRMTADLEIELKDIYEEPLNWGRIFRLHQLGQLDTNYVRRLAGLQKRDHILTHETAARMIKTGEMGPNFTKLMESIPTSSPSTPGTTSPSTLTWRERSSYLTSRDWLVLETGLESSCE
jgi:hypothetical protein